jgi:5-methyltetrahydropteroyltriglutamate--homocysteine methyltransferase
MHLEMANRELAEAEIVGVVGARRDVAVGVIDVKSYYLETPDDVVDRLRVILQQVPPERLAAAPDCGLSQTARWAARAKLRSLCQGVAALREELGV